MTRHCVTLSVLLFASHASARCPNGCNGKGSCASNNKCECYPFYQGSDCSHRTCPSDYAFIDTPIGDINADGEITMTVAKSLQTGYVLEAYPINYGLARAIDGDTEKNLRWDEGHFYAECSNKGLCNRKTGECECFPGYTGAGCKRTTCPGETESGKDCSGHGVCQKAFADIEYSMWDKHKTMKCQCHAAYTGPDCSMRRCMANADPIEAEELVLSQVQKIAFATVFYETGLTPNIVSALNGEVLFTVSVADEWGEVWTTDASTITYETLCGTPGAGDPNDASNPATLGGLMCEMAPKLSETNFVTGTNELDKSVPLVADTVNASLRALPNAATSDVYVWMSYTTNAVAGREESVWQTDFAEVRYPEGTDGAHIPDSVIGLDGYTTYLNSPRTRFPDFQNDAVADLEQAMYCNLDNSFEGYLDTDDQNLIVEQRKLTAPGAEFFMGEGLCIYISTTSRTETNYEVSILGSSFQSGFFEAATGLTLGPDANVLVAQMETTAAYSASPVTGSATSVTHDDAGEPSTLIAGTAVFIIDTGYVLGGYDDRDAANFVSLPLVTVEAVGHRRYWDINIDGIPKKLFTPTTSYECSKRGLCDYTTGLCDCFQGFGGADCSAQNAISYEVGGNLRSSLGIQ